MLRGGMTIEPKRAFRLFSKPLTPTRLSLEYRRAAFFSGSFIVSCLLRLCVGRPWARFFFCLVSPSLPKA